MRVSIRPLGSRVIVEPIAAVEVTPGGIVLAEAAQERPTRGIVVAIGEGLWEQIGGKPNPDSSLGEPLYIKLGDEVLFSAYAGSEVEINGVAVKVLLEGEIIAVVEREEDQ